MANRPQSLPPDWPCECIIIRLRWGQSVGCREAVCFLTWGCTSVLSQPAVVDWYLIILAADLDHGHTQPVRVVLIKDLNSFTSHDVSLSGLTIDGRLNSFACTWHCWKLLLANFLKLLALNGSHDVPWIGCPVLYTWMLTASVKIQPMVNCTHPRQYYTNYKLRSRCCKKGAGAIPHTLYLIAQLRCAN